jgi:hypothetical protein
MLYCRRCGEPYLQIEQQQQQCHNCKNLLVLTADVPQTLVRLSMQDSFLPVAIAPAKLRISGEFPRVLSTR